MPLCSWPLRRDFAGDQYQVRLIGIGRRQGDLDAGFEFLDAYGDFEEGPAQGFEGRLAPARTPRRGLAQAVQQPVGAGMQEEPELVGLPTMARRTVGFRIELVILDHVLNPAPGAVDFLVQKLSPAGQIGHDEADVGALRCRLDAGDDPAFARQQNAAIRRQPSAIEPDGQFLAHDG